MTPRNIFFASLLAVALAGCQSSSAGNTSEPLFPGGEIPFPEVPDTVLEPAARAGYVLSRFWEPLDFSRTDLSCDTTFMEQNFVNFAQFYPYVSPEEAASATVALLGKASASRESFRLVAYLADKYLYNRESSFYDEEAYIGYLRGYMASSHLTDPEKEVYGYILTDALKNRPGMPAADFAFRTREGRNTTLHSCNRAPYTLLIFYDSDCDDCHAMIVDVSQRSDVTSLVERGTVAVVAIDPESDYSAWDAAKGAMPAGWIVGHDLDNVLDKGLYVYPYPPSVYLLDSEKKVLLKEPSLQQLIDYAHTH